MTTRKKRWENYDEFLKSDEWKAIKAKFFDEYDGFYNVCQVTGEIFDDDEKQKLHLHHWRYPKNWNDTTSDDLILICENVHDFIHSEDELFETYRGGNPKRTDTKQKYLTCVIRAYFAWKEECSDSEHISDMRDKDKELEQKEKIVDDFVKACVRKNKTIEELHLTIESLRKNSGVKK